MNGNRYFHFSEMILMALDGQLDDEQFAEFDRRLQEDPDFRRYYLRFMAVNASLNAIDRFPAARLIEDDQSLLDYKLWLELAREERTAESVAVEIKKEPEVQRAIHYPPARSEVSKLSLVSILLAAAAMVFVIVYAHIAPVKTNSPIGRLTKTVDAQWQDASGQIAPGCELYAGPMSLLRGYAEITLEGGAVVIVQAPCRLTLESAQQIFLQEGKIVAALEEPGEQTFVVRSPTASVVDYGTEFGVQVDARGETQTYVYRGQVQIRDSSDPVKFMRGLLLKAGQGAAADAKHNLVSRNVDPKQFVRADELEARYQAHRNNGYYRWKVLIYQLHRDPSLAAHYFFEKSQTDPDRLVNAVFPDSVSQQGVFGDKGRCGPTWTQGRWPQKAAVCFERGKDHTIVIPPDADLSIASPLTLCTWVCFPNADRWGGHLISCRDNHRINYQFSLFDEYYLYNYQKNRFEFRQYDKLGGKGFYSRPFVPETGRWYHLAMTYDGSEIRLYVNGELFQTEFYTGLTAASPAEIILGAVKIGEYTMTEGDFDGIVDELLIFRRALPEAEIRTLYEVGKP